jgi:hemoglobin/transferrin/lactoferrin receptor protein
MLNRRIFRRQRCDVEVLGETSRPGCRMERATTDSWRPPAAARRLRALSAVALGAALCGFSTARAQEAATAQRHGIIVDESGSAIPAAQYVVLSAHGVVLLSAATAADGTFTIEGLPSGSYWVEVAASHFQVRRVSLEIGRNDATPLRVVLGLAPVHSEVTVTAQRGAISDVDRTPSIVTVRQEADFRRRPMATIGNALEGAAGVMVQQSTYGQASPFLRGLTGYHVLNLIDGVRFNNSTFRSGPNQYLALADPSQAERIEALLGPASSQFGSDALGGAIQVLTPVVRFGGGSGRVLTGRVNLFGASADTSRGADGGIFIRGRGLSWMGGASSRRLNDLRAGGGNDSHHVLRRFFGLTDEQIREVSGGRQTGTGFSQTGFHTKMDLRPSSQQNVTLWYQRSEQKGVRGYKDLWGGLGRVRSEFDPQRLQFFYGRYQRLDVGRLDWLSGTFSVNSQKDGSVRQGLRSSDQIVRDDVRVDALGYAVQAGAHLAGRHAIVFGGEVYDEGVDARRDHTDPRAGTVEEKRALYPNGSLYRTSGAFLHDAVDLFSSGAGSRLTARLGGRLTRIDVKTEAGRNRSRSGRDLGVTDFERSYHDWTFNAGLTWDATRVLSFNVLAGRGFRAPNLADLGALGLNDLGYEVPAESAIESGALIGNGDGEGALSTGRPVMSLKSERLFNYELGTTLRWRRLYSRVQAFTARLKDPIVRRTLVFPIDRMPSMMPGVAVAPIAPTSAQRQQGIGSVATAFDPRAIKAFVNDGRARYDGVEALFRLRLSARWSAEGNYSYQAGRDLDPARPVRRLPPQQGFLSVRYQPARWNSWIEGSAHLSGAQEHLSGGDLTDERIGAARRRSDIVDFFRGALIAPYILPGNNGLAGSADDVFSLTGETVSQICDRVLPVGATVNGVTITDNSTRVPLFTRTPPFVSVNLRAGVTITDRVDLTFALMNAFDRNYRVHGSGVDAPGISVFAGMALSY